MFYINIGKIKKNEEDGRKSIPYQAFKEHAFLIPFGYQPRLDYLSVVEKYLLVK